MQHLLIGLGNPGPTYEKTRHNVGWILMDQMFPEAAWKKNTYAEALVAEVVITEADDAVSVTLAKPQTFMNESGKTAGYFTDKEGLLPEHLIVMYDDLDLPVGSFKISFDRGSGGHNGIKSIESHLGSREFIRIRIGISKPNPTEPDHSGQAIKLLKPNVLGNFEAGELEQLATLAPTIKRALITLITEGKDKAMSLFNLK